MPFCSSQEREMLSDYTEINKFRRLIKSLHAEREVYATEKLQGADIVLTEWLGNMLQFWEQTKTVFLRSTLGILQPHCLIKILRHCSPVQIHYTQILQFECLSTVLSKPKNCMYEGNNFNAPLNSDPGEVPITAASFLCVCLSACIYL